METPIIGAVILAAGEGKRFGMPKYAFRIDGTSCLTKVCALLIDAGIKEIVSVIRASELENARTLLPSGRIVLNPDPARGMFSSLLCGAETLSNCDGIIVMPVDHPFVHSSTIRMLIEAFCSDPAAVCSPLYKNISGHPVVIPKNILRGSTASASLREVIGHSAAVHRIIDCDDGGVIRNVNSPEDLHYE